MTLLPFVLLQVKVTLVNTSRLTLLRSKCRQKPLCHQVSNGTENKNRILEIISTFLF